MNALSRTCRIVAGNMLLLTLCSAFASENNQAAANADARYLIKNETVYDKKTNLTWARCSVGQHWLKNTGCEGVPAVYKFEEALKLRSGKWRMPTKEELATLIDENRKARQYKPTIDEAAFPGMDQTILAYWSSTRYDDTNAWNVYFGNGYTGFSDISAPYAVRLVRDGK